MTINFQPKEFKSDEYQKTTKQEAETRLLAKRRKEAMKKKQLNLWLLFYVCCDLHLASHFRWINLWFIQLIMIYTCCSYEICIRYTPSIGTCWEYLLSVSYIMWIYNFAVCMKLVSFESRSMLQFYIHFLFSNLKKKTCSYLLLRLVICITGIVIFIYYIWYLDSY